MTKYKSKHAAFTLIEALVVMSIVLLVLAILLPAITKHKDAANLAICSNNLHEVHVAYLSWRTANPRAVDHQKRIKPGWTRSMWQYLGKYGKMLHCPNDQTAAMHDDLGTGEDPGAFAPPSGSNTLIKKNMPKSLALGRIEGGKIKIYKERSNYKLPRNVSVDIKKVGLRRSNKGYTPGRIDKGTVVDVYLVHFDPGGKGGNLKHARVSFGGEILGIIAQTHKLSATDGYLGKPGVKYYTNQYRGLENANDMVTLEDDRTSLTINNFSTPGWMEEMRVIVSPGSYSSYAMSLDGNSSVLFSDYYGKSLFYIKEEVKDPYLQAYLDDPSSSPGRHFGKINVVLEGGDVQLIETRDFFDPKSKYWSKD